LIENLVENEQFAGLLTRSGDFGLGYLDVAGCLGTAFHFDEAYLA
jgi:hypothetical protein